MQPRDPVQAVWVGKRFSAMERLCAESFLSNGHEFHLYIYDDVGNLPPGTVVRDGNEILPAARIFQYYEHPGTYSGFSNFFRYKLLLERGGWYVDTDVVCLRPFDFENEYVFSAQGIRTQRLVSTGIIKAPAGSEIMRRAWEACDEMDTSTLRWGVSGPTLMTRVVAECGLAGFVQPPEVFLPFDYPDWERQLDGGADFDFPQAHAVHLWGDMWRRAGKDKDGAYPPDCLYERLKRRFADGSGQHRQIGSL